MSDKREHLAHRGSNGHPTSTVTPNGTVEASRVATGTTDDLTLEVHGTNGALKFDLMDPNWLHVYDGRSDGSPIGGYQWYPAKTSSAPWPDCTTLTCLATSWLRR